MAVRKRENAAKGRSKKVIGSGKTGKAPVPSQAEASSWWRLAGLAVVLTMACTAIAVVYPSEGTGLAPRLTALKTRLPGFSRREDDRSESTLSPSVTAETDSQFASSSTRPRGLLRDRIDTLGSEPILPDISKRDAILSAFTHSYRAYERDAFGFDAYHPISHTGSNFCENGPVGYFIVDSLDSLLLAGLEEEYSRARDWVSELSFDINHEFHTFEITIRVLGGLLSAFHLTNDDMYRHKAVDLADRLLAAFDTPSGIPLSFVNLHTRQGVADKDNQKYASLAEVGTLQLELKYLSHITGNATYGAKATAVMDTIRAQPSLEGLYPLFIDANTGRFAIHEIRLGSRADSYYEYLIKQYLQTNRTEPVYRLMHQGAIEGIKSRLLKRSPVQGLYYTQELHPVPDHVARKMTIREVLKQDHLVCFLPSVMMLGAGIRQRVHPLDEQIMDEPERDDMFVAKELLKGCIDTYQQSETGLAPEIAKFYNTTRQVRTGGHNRDWYIDSRQQAAPNAPIDARNILRPETVESLFYAYRLTGDPIYRKWAWDIFEAFDKHCKLENGAFASISDVDTKVVNFEDNMETFWISETLKYLYLIFSDSETLSLKEYVFNTEAHPLPIFTPKKSVSA